MMNVKFIKYHVLFAHDVDDVCELTDFDAEKLIESGHVVAVEKGEPVGNPNEEVEEVVLGEYDEEEALIEDAEDAEDSIEKTEDTSDASDEAKPNKSAKDKGAKSTKK